MKDKKKSSKLNEYSNKQSPAINKDDSDIFISSDEDKDLPTQSGIKKLDPQLLNDLNWLYEESSDNIQNSEDDEDIQKDNKVKKKKLLCN